MIDVLMFLPQATANKAMTLLEKDVHSSLANERWFPKIPNRLESQLKRSVVVVFN